MHFSYNYNINVGRHIEETAISIYYIDFKISKAWVTTEL